MGADWLPGLLDLEALEAHLRTLEEGPAVIAATAGEVNAGDFDPIDALADLAEEYGAWLHVDGHKWLNVPYDSGYAFVHDRRYMTKAFAYTADYLWDEDDPRPGFGHLGPESSRRARSLAVWATLRPYGHEGYRAIVERHLDLAQELAALVDAAPELERLAEVPLNVVCFRYDPEAFPPVSAGPGGPSRPRSCPDYWRFQTPIKLTPTGTGIRPSR